MGNEFKLPGWENVWVTLEIVDGPNGSSLERTADERMKEGFHKHLCAPVHIRPFAYFKFKEPDEDRKLRVTVKYSRSAWDASSKASKGDYPELYYREYDGTNWGNEWVPITDNVKVVQIPSIDDPYGILTADLPFIPDPAIGGC